MAGRRIVHQLGPVAALFIDRAVILIQRVHPAARSAQHHTGAGRQLAGKGQPRLCQRLAGGDQGELGKAVIKRDLLAVEPFFRVIALDLPADADRQTFDTLKRQFRDPAAPLAHGLQRLRHIRAQGVDRALTGNDHAPHAPVPAP